MTSVSSVSLSGDAQVRLVDAVVAHRVFVGHHRERIRQRHAEHFLEQVARERFHQRADRLLAEERGLDVDLRELGLPVGAQVLVAEALDDLVVAVEARDHQHLLEQLRALRQRVELAVVDARGHEELARALGRGLVEHRRLDVDEAVAVEEAARRLRRGVAQAQVLLHRVAPQVEDAVLEAHRLREVVVVELERRRERRVEDLDFVRQHLDLARAQVRIDGARGPRAHHAR